MSTIESDVSFLEGCVCFLSDDLVVRQRSFEDHGFPSHTTSALVKFRTTVTQTIRYITTLWMITKHAIVFSRELTPVAVSIA